MLCVLVLLGSFSTPAFEYEHVSETQHYRLFMLHACITPSFFDVGLAHGKVLMARTLGAVVHGHYDTVCEGAHSQHVL